MKRFRKYTVSAVLPCYNDENTIAGLIKNLDHVLKQLTSKYEIIVVDDCSQDGSREKLNLAKLKYPKLRLIYHQKNMGYGKTIKSGFLQAKYDLVFYTDGDGQYDVNELPLLIGLMSDDVDFVNGIKLIRQDEKYRVIAGNLHNFLVRWLFWLPVFDTDCDFRLIRKNLLQKINLKCKTAAFCVCLVKKADLAGATFAEVSVHHYPRKYGHSQFFKPKAIIVTYLELTKLWFELMILRKVD